MTLPFTTYAEAVLWALSYLAPNTVAAVYEAGKHDGQEELRRYMRRSLEEMHAAIGEQKLLDFDRGFRAGVSASGYHSDREIEVLKSRTVGPSWIATEGKRPA